MATLEKIRSKSVLLLIIIGGALIAFIIGDFFTSGRTLFGTGTTIAKVAGQKIDVQDFQRKVQEAQEYMQNQGQKMDGAVLQQQVLDQMIDEALLKQEFEDLGLKVTDAELSDFMIGNHSQMINQAVQQQYGIESAQMMHDMVTNPQKYGVDPQQAEQLKQEWLKLEDQAEQFLLQQKFQNLFLGTLVANDLDAKGMYDENQTSNMAYARKDYSSLSDDKYPVSADEIKARYDKEKKRYELPEETRLVDYIAVEIAPSNADQMAAKARMQEGLKALQDMPETQGLAEMTDFVVERKIYTPGMLANRPKMTAFLDSASVGMAKLLDTHPNEYQLIKLIDRPMEVDSAYVAFMAVQGKKAQVDSLVTVLNSGVSMDSINSPIVAGMEKEVKISLVDPNYAEVKDMIIGAQIGKFFTPDTTAENGRIFCVTHRDSVAPMYDLATAVLTVVPSNATLNNLQSTLQKYLNTNTTAEAFNKNAKKAGYTIIPVEVSASTPLIGMLPESHAAVAWVMEEAEKGQVSKIFGDEQSGNYIAVAVKDIYDGDYRPVRDAQVTNEITNLIRNDKKAESLINQYKGKASDLAGYAKLMGTDVQNIAVTFGAPMVANMGAEPRLQGQVAAAKANTLVGPIQGENGVIVFMVNSVDEQGRPYAREENANRYQMTRGGQSMMQDQTKFSKLLRGHNKVKNNINKFYNK